MPRLKLFFLIFILCLFWHKAAFAADVIRKIVINGNERVETETINSYLRVKVGDNFNSDLIDSSLQNLFSTGLFSDVSFDAEGSTLILTVQENPIVNEIAFEGNKRINDEDLLKEISLRPRSVYTKTDLQNDVRRITDVYSKSGRFSVVVEPKIIKLEQNRINLVFEIDEGKQTEIGRIFFIGNNNFSERKLKTIIQTKESRWWRFLTSDDNYDTDRVQFDQELLRRFYTSHGFADFRVNAVNVELIPESDTFFITYALEEGRKYKFGKMNITSDFSDLEIPKLQQNLKTKENQEYNSELIEDTISELIKKIGNYGYAFVDITPEFRRDTENGVIDLTYHIKEGPRVYVENINITGNVRTLDKVIRREFRIAEGDPYNTDKIKRSQQRIRNLGFFDRAEIKNTKGSGADRVNINVDVQEKSTGELTLGAGFSTTDGALADIGLAERNLLGAGYNTRLSLRAAQRRQEVDIGFTDPYFLDKEIAAGFDLFSLRRDRRSQSSFDSQTNGFNLRTSYPVTEHLTHSLKYTLRSDDIQGIREDASRFIKKLEGKTVTSMIGHSFLLDKTDNKFDPTEGHFIKFNQDFGGLGGDTSFVRHELRTGYFMPTINNKWVLKLSLKGGYVFGTAGKDVDINNRFFLGGVDLRGFKSDGVGPHDKTTGDALGGNTYYTGSTEFSFPLGLPEELGFAGSVFVDAGSLFDIDEVGSEIEDDSSLRVSSGIGISWSSPLGPVRVDIAEAIVKNDFDEPQTFRISFGTKF